MLRRNFESAVNFQSDLYLRADPDRCAILVNFARPASTSTIIPVGFSIRLGVAELESRIKCALRWDPIVVDSLDNKL